MSAPHLYLEAQLIGDYELLRAQILSAGSSCPLSQTDRRIFSEGLLQWALGKQVTQQRAQAAAVIEEVSVATIDGKGRDHLDVNVVHLIASMAIQSITQSQRFGGAI